MTDFQKAAMARRQSYGLIVLTGEYRTGRVRRWHTLSMDQKLHQYTVAFCGLWKRAGSGPRLARWYRKRLVQENDRTLTKLMELTR